MRLFIKITIILLISAFIGYSLYLTWTAKDREANEQARLQNYITHAQPRALSEFTFTDALGQAQDLSAYHGNIVIVNFWATWCAPCRKEMPLFDKLQTHFADAPLKIVAISMDQDPKKAIAFLNELGVNQLETGFSSIRVMSRLGITGLPTTLILDRQGNELGRVIGEAQWNSPEIIRLIQSYISTQG